MATKNFLANQILLKLEAGYPDVANSVQLFDLYAAIDQKINIMFKMQQFNETFAAGETIPNGLVLATYSSPVVTFGGKKSISQLPVMPVSLTRNMGVYEVSTNEFFDCVLIPMQSGQAALLKGQPLICGLLNQIGYEVYGSAIITNKDITIDNIDTLWMRLVVMDISSYDEYTSLPIPADYDYQIIDEIYKSFVPVEAAEIQSNGIVQQPKKVQK